MKKVLFIEEPQKEEKPLRSIALTHVKSFDWVAIDSVDFNKFSKIVYLGKCSCDGDCFAGYTKEGFISFYKGYLNDGVY